MLYQNPLNASSDLNDFTAPGNNTLPLILDAMRDRAVWEGDLSVSGEFPWRPVMPVYHRLVVSGVPAVCQTG